MSLSGSFNTSSYNNMYIEFSWWGSQSISGNYTDVNWTATCRRSSGSGGYYAHWSIVIAGETVNSRSQSNRILITNGNVIASGTKRIYHNNDGTKSFSASVSAAIYTYATNCTGSGSWTLNTIPRYANPVPTLTARTETSLTVAWTADGTVDNFQYSIDNGATWSTATDPESTTGNFTVSGLTADTAYSVKLKARRKDSQLTNESTTVSMSTYSYPYASTMPDFVIGNSVMLTLFNPLGRTVTVTMDGATGSTSTTTLTLTPTASTLYALIPNAKSGTYSVSVAYSGQTQTRTGGLYKVDENANKPVIGAFTYADSNGTATAITQDASKIVQNISTPQYTATGLTAQNSATLATVSVEVNGATYTNSSPSGTTNVQGGVINSTTDVIATLTVTDSRGITNTKTVTVSMIAWNQPSAIITVERQANFYAETDMTVDASYTQIGSSTITISVLGQAVPIAGQVTPSDVTATLTDNVQSTVLFDNNFAWNIAITLTDSFGGTTTYNRYISRGIPEVFFDRYRNSVGINQFPQHDNSVELTGDSYYLNGNPLVDLIYPVGSIYMSVNSANPSSLFGGTWVQIKDTFLLSAGDTYSGGDTGGEETHTLTLGEIPSHVGHMPSNTSPSWGEAGEQTYYMPIGNNPVAPYSTNRPYVLRAGNEIVPRGTSWGGDQPHNNMPPYLVVYVWKRTA